MFTRVDGHDGSYYSINVLILNGKTCGVSYNGYDDKAMALMTRW